MPEIFSSPRIFGVQENTSHNKADPSRPIAHRAMPYGNLVTPPASMGNSNLDSEAWHACAGPLVCLPQVDERVVYFPQGHIEQVVASTNQSADFQVPHYNLPSQILCRVLNIGLGAYRETDEVYAQMTLVPENEQIDHYGDIGEPPYSRKPVLSMFCKNLTSSDTSTHGGFSVPRRAAEECFPLLDYQQSPPAQELIAKDLHGVEWKFRHIYRGQPRRHLLTTGWSAFVSQKKLVAGDAVLFVRGDNGELRIGVRRAVRTQNSITSSSLLSSHSMQLGVLAAAAHAVSTKTMFTIFYNPRASPAEFVVPHYKYVKAFKLNLAVGMRFKMRFETEDSSERRYMGTITGIGDFDSTSWPNSRWRCLKVGWDEHAASERQERVSPWEIEPFIAPNILPSVASFATKRLRPTMLSENIGMRSYELASSMHLQQILRGSQLAKKHDDDDGLQSPWGCNKWRNVSWLNELRTSPLENWSHDQQLKVCVEQFKEQSGYGVSGFRQSATELSTLPNSDLLSPRLLMSLSPNMRVAPVDTCTTSTVHHLREKEKDGDCKLFGFSLNSLLDNQNDILPAKTHTLDRSCCAPSVAKNTTLPIRTCTKVHKQGAVGRAVDVTKFEGYSDLLKEIGQLFGIEEKLNDSDDGWQAVYIDHDGDMLLIGDDPWEEFCGTVRNIRILSPMEIEKMTESRNKSSKVNDEPSIRDVSKLSDQQDSSSSPPNSKSNSNEESI